MGMGGNNSLAVGGSCEKNGVDAMSMSMNDQFNMLQSLDDELQRGTKENNGILEQQRVSYKTLGINSTRWAGH